VIVLAGHGRERAAAHVERRARRGLSQRDQRSAGRLLRKVARGETWVQDVAVPSELTENDMVGLRVRDRLTAKDCASWR